jgi:hypothetical protein
MTTAMSNTELFRWVKASESLKRLPLEELIHVRDSVGCKRLGNFFKQECGISFSVLGTEMYESFVIPYKDLWSIEWLEPYDISELVGAATELLTCDYTSGTHLSCAQERLRTALKNYKP